MGEEWQMGRGLLRESHSKVALQHEYVCVDEGVICVMAVPLP